MIVLSAHINGGDHKTYNTTLAKSRQIAYIHKPNYLIKNILESCVNCKVGRERGSSQIMGKLPVNRVSPTLPFQKVSIDLVGPYNVNATAKIKTQTKIWILMYLCDVSKALHTEILDSITFKSGIYASKSCFAIKNTPSQIYTDPGTPLIGVKNKVQSE